MNAFTLKDAKENLEKVVQEVIERGNGVFIATDLGETPARGVVLHRRNCSPNA